MNEIKVTDAIVWGIWTSENKRRLEAISKAREQLTVACKDCTFRDADFGGCEMRKCSVYRVQVACMEMLAGSKFNTRLDVDGWRGNWHERGEHYRAYFRTRCEKASAEEAAEAK